MNGQDETDVQLYRLQIKPCGSLCLISHLPSLASRAYTYDKKK